MSEEAKFVIIVNEQVRGNAAGQLAKTSKQMGILGRASDWAVGKFKAAAAAIAAFAAAAAAAGALKLGQSLIFAQTQAMAFGKLMNNATMGAAQFDAIRHLAQDLGLDVQSTVVSFRKLLAAQFSTKLATDIIKMGGDLKALGSTAEEVKGAIRAISQIKSAGKLQGDELNQLSEAGISAELVYQGLEKVLGKSRDQVMKLKQAGKITDEQAIKAIKLAVKNKLHIDKLGDAAKATEKTVSGMWSRFKAGAENALIDLAQSKTGKILTEMLSGAIIAAGRAAQVVFPLIKGYILGVAVGALQFYLALRKVGREIAKAGEGFEVEGFDVMTVVFEAGKVAAIAFGVGLLLVVAAMAAMVAIGALVVAGVAAVVKKVYSVGQELGKALPDLPNKITNALSHAMGSLSGFVVQAFGVGMDIASGIANGIKIAAVQVLNALMGVVGNAMEAAKGMLGIASPSRVFMEIGANTAEGMAMGIEGGSSRVQGAMQGMADPSSVELSGKALGGGADFSGATFNFYGVADAPTAADMVEERITRLLEGHFGDLDGATT